MQVSLEWLADFVEVPSLEETCALLSRAGISIETVVDPSKMSSVVVAEIRQCKPHPNADRLTVCEIFDGVSTHSVVCGASNARPQLRTAYARVGSALPAGIVSRREVRGVESAGMLCSESDLGLSPKSDGLWELDANALLGAPVFEQTREEPRLLLELTPNRPDLMSHIGVARELAAACGKRLKSVVVRAPEMGPDINSLARVVVDDSAACQRYMGRVVRRLKVGPSPAWLKKRLERVGQRSVNNVVDVTNYVLLEYGQPLHAFDLAKIASDSGLPTIKVRRAKPDEKVKTLDGVERPLREEDLVIADANRVLALAGIMGGEDSEVSEGTQTVILESAWFEPTVVRRTARRYGLRTEAALRFERGADPQMVQKALDRCAQLLVEVAGGEVAKGYLDDSQKLEAPREIRLRPRRISTILGFEVDAEAAVKLLEPLEIRCIARTDDALRFVVPTFRPDLQKEIDLIEEIARRVGYDAIPETIPSAAGPFVYTPNAHRRQDIARRVLLSVGFSEAVTYGFGSPHDYGEQALRLLNPLGEEFSALRTSLIPRLMSATLHNQRHGAKEVRLFEIGTVFSPRVAQSQEDVRDASLPAETVAVGFVLWGERYHGRWFGKDQTIDFSDLRGVLEALLESFDLAGGVRFVPATQTNLHPFAAVEICVDEHKVGVAGQVTPSVADKQGLSGPLFLAEVSLDALLTLPKRSMRFQKLPRFPKTRRDVAVIAEKTLSSETIREFLLKHAGGAMGPAVVENVRLFDLYRGKPIPSSKVSLAFAIEYRSFERTLTDDEVNAAFNGVLEKLRAELQIEVRD